MLKAMRKHSKYFLWLFVVIILSFIFWGVGNVDNNSTPPVAVVGEEKISLDEFWRAFDNMSDVYRQIYKDKYDENMQEQLKRTVLSSLINERVLLIAASDAGIKVTDRELQEAIMNEPTFQRDGAFSSEIYQNTLRLNRLTPAYYEAMKRRELTLDKMRKIIKDSVDLSASEVEKVSADAENAESMRNALLEQKKDAAVASYVEGLKKQMDITVNEELLS